MKNFLLLSAVAGLSMASPVQPEIESVFNHPEVVQGLERRAVPAKCNADNCARAVTGTANGLAVQSAHRDDCSSFFLATYIPPTTTNTITFTPHVDATVTQTAQITLTNTITLTETSYSDSLVNQVNKRSPNTGTLIIPSAVPTYASACSGIARFSSACACWGIVPTTTTLPAPSVVETVTGPDATDFHTQTVTQTATVVAYEDVTVGYVNPVLCGQNINTPQRHISYKIECGHDGRISGEQYRVSTSTQNTFSDCVAWVDSTLPYHAIAYSLSTKSCSAYSTWWTFQRAANSDIVFAAHSF